LAAAHARHVRRDIDSERQSQCKANSDPLTYAATPSLDQAGSRASNTSSPPTTPAAIARAQPRQRQRQRQRSGGRSALGGAGGGGVRGMLFNASAKIGVKRPKRDTSRVINTNYDDEAGRRPARSTASSTIGDSESEGTDDESSAELVARRSATSGVVQYSSQHKNPNNNSNNKVNNNNSNNNNNNNNNNGAASNCETSVTTTSASQREDALDDVAQSTAIPAAIRASFDALLTDGAAWHAEAFDVHGRPQLWYYWRCVVWCGVCRL
jgi:hypothetical protein